MEHTSQAPKLLGAGAREQLASRWQQYKRFPQIIAGGLGLLVLGLWLATGTYVVSPGEEGVIRRFGREVARTSPGLRWHWPYPIERVDVVNIAAVRRMEIGFRSTPTYQLVPQESIMLTGDQNIVDAQATVQYQVKDSAQYLFRVNNPDQALRDATEVSLRSVIGRTTIEEVLTTGRTAIEDSTLEFLQQLLDTYQTGLRVTEVKLQVIDPPEQVRDAFHEVVRAREDRERLINEAMGYQEDVLPKARGQAEQMLRAAEAYKEQRVIRSEGDAAKFVAVLEAYRKAPQVTEQRLYIEALQRVLPKAQKVIIGSQLEESIRPFLPLRDRNFQGPVPRVDPREPAASMPAGQTVMPPGRNAP